MSISVLFSPPVCLDDINVVRFVEKAAHLVCHNVLFVLCLFVILIISHFSFKGGTMVLITVISG